MKKPETGNKSTVNPEVKKPENDDKNFVKPEAEIQNNGYDSNGEIDCGKNAKKQRLSLFGYEVFSFESEGNECEIKEKYKK